MSTRFPEPGTPGRGGRRRSPGDATGSWVPGFGLLFVLLGIAVGLWGLFAVPWADSGEATLLELRASLDGVGESSNIPEIGRDYIRWIAIATFVVVAVLGIVSTVGRYSTDKWFFQTLAVGSALAANFIHYAGVWQFFYLNPDGSADGTRVMYPAYVLLLIGGVIGTRHERVDTVPPWARPPTPWNPPTPQPPPPQDQGYPSW